MPWMIPPWLALVEFLGLTAKEYDKHAFDKSRMLTMTATTATATAAMPTTGMAATMATRMKVTSTAMMAAMMTTTTMTSTTKTTTTPIGQRRCDGDNDDGTTRMERCPKPSDQPRDPARREECSDLDEKSLTTFCC
jgi:hypothetical protein